MTRIRLAFIQAFTIRGKPYYYFRRPGCARIRLPGLPASIEFNDAYARAIAASTPRSDIGQRRSAPGSVAALVASYAESSKFKHEIAAESVRPGPAGALNGKEGLAQKISPQAPWRVPGVSPVRWRRTARCWCPPPPRRRYGTSSRRCCDALRGDLAKLHEGG